MCVRACVCARSRTYRNMVGPMTIEMFLAVILFCSEKFWMTLNMAVTRLMTERLPGGRRSITRRTHASRHSTGSAIAVPPLARISRQQRMPSSTSRREQ